MKNTDPIPVTIADLAEKLKISQEEICLCVSGAKKATKESYCPYSKFRVGAALLTTTGEIIDGCNVENASYGLTICAERSAIVRAVSQGHRDFSLIIIYAPDAIGFAAPCGACRQFLVEFSPDMHVISASSNPESFHLWTAKELLPNFFGPKSLPQ